MRKRRAIRRRLTGSSRAPPRRASPEMRDRRGRRLKTGSDAGGWIEFRLPAWNFYYDVGSLLRIGCNPAPAAEWIN